MKKNSLFNCLRVALALLCCSVGTNAFARVTADQEPIITMKSSIYETYGSTNLFSIIINATDTTYIDVDCGAGPVEYELIPQDGQTSYGTLIYCSVNEDGIVKIYGDDATLIDYLNVNGCYLTSIDLSQLTNLDIVDLSHNELLDLDLSHNNLLRGIYVTDNPFTEETPLVIGDKPLLQLLEVTIVDHLDPNFDLTQYPDMRQIDAYHTPSLTKIDPTQCPKLTRLSLEMTGITSIDVSKNDSLLILNVSETGVTELDITNNTKLQQLYCEHISGTFNTGARIANLDVTNNPDLIRLVANGNAIKEIDVTNCTNLLSLHLNDNLLTSIDVSKNTSLASVKLANNYLDFATLPLDSAYWTEYQYSQRPMQMDNVVYPENTIFDFSDKVLREGTVTTAALYAVGVAGLDDAVLLDNSYYTYEDGVVTLLKAHSDSLMLSFSNDAFPAATLTTERFMVKTEEDYGQPTAVCSLSATPKSFRLKLSVGLYGATEENPIEFYVEVNGDGNLLPMTATSQTMPAAPNASFICQHNDVRIYVPDGTNISALGIDGYDVASIDLSKLYGLQELALVNTGLSSINLATNNQLRTLDLSGNNLMTLDLTGINDAFHKNSLRTINLSNNNISDLTLSPLLAIHYLNIANNKIEALDLGDADYIEYVDVSGNQLSTLDFTYCSYLDTLRASKNLLTAITLPAENNIRYLALDHNQFTLSTLPQHNGIVEESYLYAPQADIVISTKGPCADLGSQLLTLNGKNTQFAWVETADGTPLQEGTDYTITDGFTRFLDAAIGKVVHCEITHTAYPAFAGEDVLKTTSIEIAGMPTNEIASFTTTNDGDLVTLSLAANAAGTSVYFDWEGNDNVVQYLLGTSYRLFTATTHKDAKVRVYTYEPTDTIRVFSISGASMSSFDGSNLLARTLTIQNAGLGEVTLQNNKDLLVELNLTDNALTTFDPSLYPNLVSLSLTGNQLSTVDLSQNKALQVAGIAGNEITDVTLDNPSLWLLDLGTNALTDIDLAGVPNMQQLSLNDNYLTTLDVSALTKLLVLSITGNYFTFATLPPVLPTYAVYYYGNQNPMSVTVVDDRIVDLSAQAVITDSITTYTWYRGVPTYDSDLGEFVGDVLAEGTDYTSENGVFTFINSFIDIMCIMTNPAFPNLYLYTELIDVNQAQAVDQVAEEGLTIGVRGRNIVVNTEAGRQVRLYTVSGMQIAATVTSGAETLLPTMGQNAYILSVDGKAYKLLVP